MPLESAHRRLPPSVTVCRVQHADDAGRVAHRHDIRRQAPGHNRPAADDGVLPDRHAGQHDRTAPEPDVVADRDRFGRLPLVPPRLRLDRVGGGEELDVGPDLDVVPDGDRRDVEGDQTEVRKTPRADVDLAAVVDVQRWPDLGAFADGAEQLLQQLAAQGPLADRRRVVGGRQVQRPAAGLGELGVVGDVELAGEHPLAHGAGIVGVGLQRHENKPAQPHGVLYCSSSTLGR
jgi:hypothetical protein